MGGSSQMGGNHFGWLWLCNIVTTCNIHGTYIFLAEVHGNTGTNLVPQFHPCLVPDSVPFRGFPGSRIQSRNRLEFSWSQSQIQYRLSHYLSFGFSTGPHWTTFEFGGHTNSAQTGRDCIRPSINVSYGSYETFGTDTCRPIAPVWAQSLSKVQKSTRQIQT